MSDPFDRLVESLRAAQRSYYARASEEERERHKTCPCGMCAWIRGIDELIADYDAGKRGERC